MATPTLSDILGYGAPGGGDELMNYLSSLILDMYPETDISGISQIPTAYQTTSGDLYDPASWGEDVDAEEKISTIFSLLEESYDKDFTELSSDEIEGFLGSMYFNIYDAPYGGSYPSIQGKWSSEAQEGWLDLIQQAQEGFKATPTKEKWGLGEKISDIEETGERAMASKRRGYVPGEIISRYGALQGKPGMEAKGELAESGYLSDIYGLSRGVGRDVRGTYKDYESDFFDAVENWLSFM